MNIPVEKEQKIIATMILMFCRAHHGDEATPCAECAQLIAYSKAKSAKCVKRPDKPFCSACTSPCYRPEMRERIREVMRYSGPRMLYRHPLMAISHMRHGMRPKR